MKATGDSTTGAKQPPLLQRGMKQSWYEGGTRPNALATGIVSMSFESIKDFRLKFCKIVVRNKKSSMRARPSPTHIRFPGKKKKKRKEDSLLKQ
jgi:hypothetical protein